MTGSAGGSLLTSTMLVNQSARAMKSEQCLLVHSMVLVLKKTTFQK